MSNSETLRLDTFCVVVEVKEMISRHTRQRLTELLNQTVAKIDRTVAVSNHTESSKRIC